MIQEHNNGVELAFKFDKIKGIIFDLDDTLVKSTLDFALIKQLLKCPKEVDILKFIHHLKCPIAKQAAKDLVVQYEIQDAYSATWLNGASAFVQQAQSLGLPLAIVTRNCREATQIKVANNNIPIDLVLTREDAAAKPAPEALLTIADAWQIPTIDIAYIGDFVYDIQAAHNANMQAWLYTETLENKLFAYADRLRFIPYMQ